MGNAIDRKRQFTESSWCIMLTHCLRFIHAEWIRLAFIAKIGTNVFYQSVYGSIQFKQKQVQENSFWKSIHPFVRALQLCKQFWCNLSLIIHVYLDYFWTGTPVLRTLLIEKLGALSKGVLLNKWKIVAETVIEISLWTVIPVRHRELQVVSCWWDLQVPEDRIYGVLVHQITSAGH